ncbi:MAG: ammonia-forming cytochrome c nitrite reductase subunit c552 [Bacteroidales bacterium]|nr:ammonia-forming cytochrome c nitrite reductase subunit c552 [Bacteroidales bacterium]
MKNPIKFLLLLTVTGFILISCEGPMGPAGKDGLDGLAGKDANETCKICHNSTSVDLISVQYEFSKHGYGEAAFEEAGSTSCGPCHLQEAFKYVCKNNTPVAFVNTAGVYSNPYVTSSSTAYGEIGCSTCHSSLHTTFAGTEFLPLTTTAAVPMTMWSGTKTINLTQKGGESNLCIKCHQPRPFTRSNTTDKNVLNYAGLVSAPTAVFYDAAQSNSLNVLKPSYRTHTHYGTAGAVYAGQGGVEFGTGYANSWHTTGASCQDCHMAPITGKAGGHTFVAKGNFNGCNVTGCHSATPITSATTTKYWKLTRDAVKLKLDQLAAKLTIGGVDILNRNGDSESNLWAGLTTNNYDGYLNIYDPITNPTVQTYNTKSFQYIGTPPSTWTQAQKDYNATLPLITLTNAQMGAIINFQLCLRDYSLGIHNTTYTTTLLTNTIAALP